ncbi:hypothetical protein IscW_ISCW001155 [Ixodes scapularis]|uniref:Uncharacterized protein n=1 Tax=Ixodes scapularis TaxID=6945 RepID=B7P185_IXOSC|nr:hypothetical protein IscW_ISCW001155 [Ixodes scapularis]|eukprot:XP_002400611.1 hypothetical protein IscW_ISCW001155 [Ixodes scapularis]
MFDLNKNITGEKLFNLLCLCGTVVRIKCLKGKNGCGLLQTEDPLAVERATGQETNKHFFDLKMQHG